MFIGPVAWVELTLLAAFIHADLFHACETPDEVLPKLGDKLFELEFLESVDFVRGVRRATLVDGLRRDSSAVVVDNRRLGGGLLLSTSAKSSFVTSLAYGPLCSFWPPVVPTGPRGIW